MKRKQKQSLTQFKAVYSSGIFIPDGAAVTALSLLFEKVYLPNNVELIKEFSKYFLIKGCKSNESVKIDINITDEDGSNADPFHDLTPAQKMTAHTYIELGMRFSLRYAHLYGQVFETNLFKHHEPIKVTLIKKGAPGSLNKYRVSSQPMQIVSEDEYVFPNLISEGYVPVIGDYHPGHVLSKQLGSNTAKQLAALLAMKSVQLLFPATKSVDGELILEARDRLSDHLPPFWSSMLKLSVELKRRIKECRSTTEVIREGEDIIETTVRPALIDLTEKLNKDRKNWFYNILSPVQKGLRLMIGNPPLTQQQLITNALVLGADVATTAAGHMKAIEALKGEAGLTFLLELGKIMNKKP